MKRIVTALFIFTCLLSMQTEAQQYLRMSQYMYNPYFINPAVAGTLNQVPIYVSYRNQWAGFKGAPTTYMASAHFQGPQNSGFGAIVTHDDTGGAISRTGIDLTGAYHIDLNNYDAVSFGLSLTARQFKFDNSKLITYQPDDLTLAAGAAESSMNLDANVGFIIYGKDYYAGFSVPQLIQSNLKLEGPVQPEDNENIRHFQFMGSYKYYLTNDWDLQPSALMKFTPVTPVQLDVNLKLGFRDMLWTGLTYRHKDAIALNVAGQMENFFVGYSFDFTTGAANVLSPYTHELLIGYIIPGKRGKYESRGALGPRILDRSRVQKK